ncbi:phosphoribosylaminoimidazolesuccinocarboxamide synthase [Puniceicoccales bacterium CK1056]|uniref:Phosphoribosylaminoimidazole-succinocarboxamide synthase n=1 Tax=Oceanipulchritudo coccoides TaxID=2706888 RepID=A0A6B2LZG9_9BACT|nr:phosphoribosylaminoimidazolesuccinocarboxamide synthase [Oceanipulchritudo coccoides]NDV62121.1 phosphoribosylaminoimidazolesuccinocarboxamide synthase [Oceanipulchritudo coccoides]
MDARTLREALPKEALLQLPELPFKKVGSGKVREIYDTGEAFLIIATDRLSAFDVVLPDGIPGKGIILTQISLFWFEETASLIRNHLVPGHAEALSELLYDHKSLIPRSMLVHKRQPLSIEAVVRQYLAGSGWKDYLKTGSLFGLPVPSGLRESESLPVPFFTPTTKAQAGEHDIPITPEEGYSLVGESRFEEVRDISLKLFALGSAAARACGLILADTKFEFGTDGSGKLSLIDEILTPDSSRYWPKDSYEPGQPQKAFDKQYVRDYLETLDWDKTAPGPKLPQEIILQTQARYLEAADKLLPK